jgi:hypothetical protein
MGQYKYKEIDEIVNVMDGDTVVARYKVNKSWVEKNLSVKEDGIHIRLNNRMRKYIDCIVELNNDKIQEISNL